MIAKRMEIAYAASRERKSVDLQNLALQSAVLLIVFGVQKVHLQRSSHDVLAFMTFYNEFGVWLR